MSDPRSEATLSLLSVIRRVERLDVSADEIVAYFTEQRQTTYSPAGDGAARPPKISPLYPTPLTSDFLPLTELHGKVTGRKPRTVRFPDGTTVSLNTGNDLLVEVIRWVAERHGLPELPYLASRGRRCLLNTSPSHPDGSEMIGSRSVTIGGRDIFVHCNRSNDDKLRAAMQFCKDRRVDPLTIKVQLEARPHSMVNHEQTRPAPKFVLVDGHSLFYRAFLGTRYLSTSNGRPTNALFGFMNMLPSSSSRSVPQGSITKPKSRSAQR